MNLDLLESYLKRADCNKEFFVWSLYAITKQYGYYKSYIRDMSFIVLEKDDKNRFDHLKMLIENNIPFIITYDEAFDDLKFVNNSISSIPSVTNDGAATILLVEFHKQEMQQRIKEAQLMELV